MRTSAHTAALASDLRGRLIQSGDANWSMVMAGVDPRPVNDEKITNWARDHWQAPNPYSTGAAYMNFMKEEGDERARATYGANHDRLRTVKATYDPVNFFHINHHITPA